MAAQAAEGAGLPAVSREQVLQAAVTTSGLLGIAGLALRSQAGAIAKAVFGADGEMTQQLLVGGWSGGIWSLLSGLKAPERLM